MPITERQSPKRKKTVRTKNRKILDMTHLCIYHPRGSHFLPTG